jgi:hypothetical protein
VHDHGVAVAHERQQLGESRPGGVLAGGGVGEDPVDGDALELANGVLIDGADPDVPDPTRIAPPPSAPTVSG